MSRPGGTRLDRALVDRGLLPSRSRAAREIAAGRVSVNGTPATKPSTEVADTDEITVSDPDPWVARSAHKLLGALDDFGIDRLDGLTALDAGASTGGFTQVLLSRGVDEVWAVDVGHDQLAATLRDDPRVHVREGLNLRDLADSDVPAHRVDLVVADVSFISLRLLVAPLLGVVRPSGELLLMVKPQFELARSVLDKHGVVTRPADRRRAVESVLEAITHNGARVSDIAASSLPGPSGNREYFLRVRPESNPGASDRLVTAEIPDRLDAIMQAQNMEAQSLEGES
ncbi:TlyA family RNA methyltransferase [Brevibacterium casei]|uniref:23S rRNA (Cytidine1920-2'-O)/16S rRNA (Cytidine1409-2'-O)-methyltransferase n=1 Tax=Brevibacterium casei CIP 102111 TaxID=1255625 RepID=A0A2H1I2T1_9MICO|nr:TlyA family RNA methyltransferase [Brevibacterium casei]QPR40799.1 TlyA family RNA methyltransferase [Brevibacterium casei]QPR44955.1 TlyA family RNA methyltransferase [Brevibacterium casei]SMX69424.1 23S rRNA (cytidine1920-2'-O)/16S rRNA (cytidine1409-2'-O)-methyltransferase [Brevibacterium casei CIP 102111]